MSSARLIKINKNIPSTSTTGVYHEFVFANGRKCFVDPENRNYWGQGWGHIVDAWPDTRDYILNGLKLKTGYSTRYDADYLSSIEPPEAEVREPENNINDLFDIS